MAATSEIATLGPQAPLSTVDRLAEIDRKLDRLADQVGYLYQRTAAVEELKDELVPVVRDAMGALGEELAAIEHEFNAEEVVYLLRKLLRNTPRLIRLLDRLESLDGLAAELEPLGKEVVSTVVNELETIEQRGHFRVLRGGLAALDRVASHYTQQDVDRFVDNAVLIVDTVQSLTRPEILAIANGAAEAIGGKSGERDAPERVGLWRLMRAMRDPKVQAGMGVALAVLRQIGEAATPSNGTDAAGGAPSGGESDEERR